MLRFILYAILIWIFYRLIVGFVIPVYKTTTQVKKQFRDMQEKMRQEEMKQQGYQQQKTEAKPNPKAPVGDYIDFEEIK